MSNDIKLTLRERWITFWLERIPLEEPPLKGEKIGMWRKLKINHPIWYEVIQWAILFMSVAALIHG